MLSQETTQDGGKDAWGHPGSHANTVGHAALPGFARFGDQGLFSRPRDHRRTHQDDHWQQPAPIPADGRHQHHDARCYQGQVPQHDERFPTKAVTEPAAYRLNQSSDNAALPAQAF